MREKLDKATDVLAELAFDIGATVISIGVVGLIMTYFGIEIPMSLWYPFAIGIVMMFGASIAHGVLFELWFNRTLNDDN